jgi:lysophospholipase L1-like esterase
MKTATLVSLILAMMTSFAQPLPKSEPVDYLALGDSYTIGESVAEQDRWPNQLASLLNQKGYRITTPHIIATTGWRTDDLSRAMDAAGLSNTYGLVSLLIGVNNQYQGKTVESYRPEFEALLKRAVALAGGRKERVFVVSIPDYGYTPFGQPKQATISLAIDQYNAANHEITIAMGIRYFYITELTRKGLMQPELVAEDKLHPSGSMYAQWANLIAADF